MGALNVTIATSNSGFEEGNCSRPKRRVQDLNICWVPQVSVVGTAMVQILHLNVTYASTPPDSHLEVLLLGHNKSKPSARVSLAQSE